MNNIQNSQEIHEAINAADDALIALRGAERSLASASGLGIWDMLGGGLISSFFKHSKIDQAQDEIDEACAALSRFKNELRDLRYIANFDLDVGGFLRFADYCFDDIFSDMMVQNKIHQGRRQVQQAIRQVEEIRARLWAMLG